MVETSTTTHFSDEQVGVSIDDDRGIISPKRLCNSLLMDHAIQPVMLEHDLLFAYAMVMLFFLMSSNMGLNFMKASSSFVIVIAACQLSCMATCILTNKSTKNLVWDTDMIVKHLLQDYFLLALSPCFVKARNGSCPKQKKKRKEKKYVIVLFIASSCAPCHVTMKQV